MPYRRLPNTDRTRVKALKLAYNKGKSIPPFQLAYSQVTFAKVELFINSFESTIAHYKSAYDIKVERGKEYIRLAKRAKLYVSHFIQVLNMAIARGELLPAIREIYGMNVDERRTPSLNTEAELIAWGRKIIDGETKRLQKGQTPISNPTIALVKVQYEQFVEAYNYQKILQQNTQRLLQELNGLRARADNIILDIWNEVEEHYAKLPDVERRKRAKEYGVTYVFRKNELKELGGIQRSFADMLDDDAQLQLDQVDNHDDRF